MKNARPMDYWLLWLAALVSLAANVWLVRVVLDTRRGLGAAAASAAQAVGGLSAASIDYSVHLEQSLPLSLTLPVSTTVGVPISVSLPISTQVTVPLNTPLGQIPLTFPVHATVPVKIEPKVPIRTTVPISITVPVVLDIPIHIAVADTSLGQPLLDAQRDLETLAAQLGALPSPPAQTPTP